MKTLISAIAVLCGALLIVACGEDEQSNNSTELETYSQSVSPTASSAEESQFVPVEYDAGVAEAELEEATMVEEAPVEAPRRVHALAKDGDKLLVLGDAGMIARTGDFSATITDRPAVATIVHNDQRWIATEGALITADGAVEIVPEFATAFTSLAVFNGELYAGTAGDGVWKLFNGALERISKEMRVIDMVAADFGLFAATDEGLYSFRDDRWQRRRFNDSSAELQSPMALYARYPYVYVGTENRLLAFDGGRWQQFELSTAVSALGWHNARLYIGGADGTLSTLEGTVLESVASPEAGGIKSILRFDKRLYVATADAVYRLRHGRFEKIEWTEPAESEPENEPIASLL